jgi:tetratricopeptide (TPR) repeat protein
LAVAKTIGETPASCANWSEAEAAKDLIATHQGHVIGHIQKAPDETVPLVVGRSGINRGIAFLRLNLGGQWDAVYRAATIFHDQDLRQFGPNSLETIKSNLDLCQSEIRLGLVSSARQRLDEIRGRLNAIRPIQAGSLIEFYQRFGSLLSELGRYAEAERFFLYAAALRENQNQSENQPRANPLGGLLMELSRIAEKLGYLDKAILYELQNDLLQKVAYPERSETFNSEVVITRLVDLFMRTERHEQVSKVLTYAHQEAKREFARDLPEPLKFPLDLSSFEQTFGPVDRSDTLSGALSNLGRVYSWMGRHEEAIPLFEQRARTQRNLFGEVSPQASAGLAMLADEKRRAGATQEALTLARTAFSSALRYVTERKSSQQSLIAGMDALNPAAFALWEASNALRVVTHIRQLSCKPRLTAR